jgi:surface polysaccharide O-acyltransferase-like enzyme
LNQERGFSVPVDLIRTVAIVGVILLHAANDLTIQQMNPLEVIRWNTVDIYQTLGRTGVPLFIMLTGALLLQPIKFNESIKVFFKKRFARIALPFIFWGGVYFAWDFFVDHQINSQAITSNSVIQGILNGPYFQFWYLYMLMGLYLLTPILRVVIAHAERDLMKYILVIWFLGSAILPLLGLFGAYQLNSFVFTFPLYAGYFILGAFLLTVKIRRSTLVILMSIGLALTAIGTYLIAFTVGGGEMYFFQEYLSPTMILASAMLFLLLNTTQSPTTLIENGKTQKANTQEVAITQKKASQTKGKKLLSLISENTLPIFLFHIIVLECLWRGYFGFTLNGNTVNSIIGIPIATALTLFICLAIIVPLKRVPVLKRLIG